MPRIWIDYCKFLTSQYKITMTRKVFDRALRALPITQHSRLWPFYLKFVKMHPIPETAVRVFRRFLKLCPEETEEFVDYLKLKYKEYCIIETSEPESKCPVTLKPFKIRGIKIFEDSPSDFYNCSAPKSLSMSFIFSELLTVHTLSPKVV